MRVRGSTKVRPSPIRTITTLVSSSRVGVVVPGLAHVTFGGACGMGLGMREDEDPEAPGGGGESPVSVDEPVFEELGEGERGDGVTVHSGVMDVVEALLSWDPRRLFPALEVSGEFCANASLRALFQSMGSVNRLVRIAGSGVGQVGATLGRWVKQEEVELAVVEARGRACRVLLHFAGDEGVLDEEAVEVMGEVVVMADHVWVHRGKGREGWVEDVGIMQAQPWVRWVNAACRVLAKLATTQRGALSITNAPSAPKLRKAIISLSQSTHPNLNSTRILCRQVFSSILSSLASLSSLSSPSDSEDEGEEEEEEDGGEEEGCGGGDEEEEGGDEEGGDEEGGDDDVVHSSEEEGEEHAHLLPPKPSQLSVDDPEEEEVVEDCEGCSGRRVVKDMLLVGAKEWERWMEAVVFEVGRKERLEQVENWEEREWLVKSVVAILPVLARRVEEEDEREEVGDDEDGGGGADLDTVQSRPSSNPVFFKVLSFLLHAASAQWESPSTSPPPPSSSHSLVPVPERFPFSPSSTPSSHPTSPWPKWMPSAAAAEAKKTSIQAATSALTSLASSSPKARMWLETERTKSATAALILTPLK